MSDAALERNFARAAAAIAQADALLIGAGAGMGVDSGLPDFRGSEGFWRAYPPFRGRPFAEISNPMWFERDPPLAWGFFGHRLALYRQANPHAGFAVLKRWAARKPAGVFVFTSNIDGQFQRAGFSELRMVECHGSIHWLQCLGNCTEEIWPATAVEVQVDPESFRAVSDLPLCPRCGKVARPNVLMFHDWGWNSRRTDEQLARYEHWLTGLEDKRLVAIELGAGTAIPTVRQECQTRSTRVVRINPRDTEARAQDIALPVGAVDGLARLDELVHQFVEDEATQF